MLPIPAPTPAPAVSDAKALAIIAASILAFWLLLVDVALLFDATATAGPAVLLETEALLPTASAATAAIPLAVPEEAEYDDGPTTATPLSVKLD